LHILLHAAIHIVLSDVRVVFGEVQESIPCLGSWRPCCLTEDVGILLLAWISQKYDAKRRNSVKKTRMLSFSHALINGVIYIKNMINIFDQ